MKPSLPPDAGNHFCQCKIFQGEKNMRTLRCCAVFATLSLSLAAAALGQAAAGPSLQELLKTQYKITTTGNDAEGFKIIEPGTVLTLKKSGALALPQMQQAQPKLSLFGKLCSTTFKNGSLTGGKGCPMMAEGAKYLNKGTQLYITKMEVKQKDNKITFNLVECDSCNGVQEQSSMKTTINVEFADKFLDTAEPGQIVDVISQVLEADAGGGAAAQAAPQAAQAAAPQAAAAGPAPTVQVGDTPDKVIGILGNPVVILPGAGGKQIYKYKDFKVIFVGGKVAEVD